jgi:hypothetical protein
MPKPISSEQPHNGGSLDCTGQRGRRHTSWSSWLLREDDERQWLDGGRSEGDPAKSAKGCDSDGGVVRELALTLVGDS